MLEDYRFYIENGGSSEQLVNDAMGEWAEALIRRFEYIDNIAHAMTRENKRAAIGELLEHAFRSALEARVTEMRKDCDGESDEEIRQECHERLVNQNVRGMTQ